MKKHITAVSICAAAALGLVGCGKSIEERPSYNDHIDSQARALENAIICHRNNYVKELLDGGFDLKEKTAVYTAAHESEESTRDKYTFLCTAASYDNLEAVKLLVEHGADPNELNFVGNSALCCAVNGSNNTQNEIFMYLLDSGAEYSVQDHRLVTELIINEDIDTLEMLENDYELDVTDMDGIFSSLADMPEVYSPDNECVKWFFDRTQDCEKIELAYLSAYLSVPACQRRSDFVEKPLDADLLKYADEWTEKITGHYPNYATFLSGVEHGSKEAIEVHMDGWSSKQLYEYYRAIEYMESVTDDSDNVKTAMDH